MRLPILTFGLLLITASIPAKADYLYPVVPQAYSDQNLRCYMHLSSGGSLDLTTLCGSKPSGASNFTSLPPTAQSGILTQIEQLAVSNRDWAEFYSLFGSSNTSRDAGP